MPTRCRPVAVLFLAAFLFAACGSDDNTSDATAATSAGAASATTAAATADSTATDGTVGTNVDCAALNKSLAGLTVNWQVVIGLVTIPTSGWSSVPLGNLDQFGDDIAAVQAVLGGNSQAAGALQYMSDANDIVQRGLGGDDAAQADLTTAIGTDAGVNVNKQIPIALAASQAGC
ncbi:MAG TPA: hypothetical protein VHQ23_10480 [Ilumatobacteraceae bacterium]|jgi:hypothetical protein|nr:hypothetical protein [Ilumatobacteraceae bacterium]